MSNKTILQSNNEALSSNNLDLQSLIDQANALPDAGGVDLPTLTNEGSVSDLLSGKELINSKGIKVTGSMPNNGDVTSTMDGIDTKSITIPKGYTSGGIVSLDNTIDNEVDVQEDLIAQIKNAVNNLPTNSGAEGSENEDAIIAGTISGDYFNDRVTRIRANVFDGCSKLTSANFPECTNIGNSAFQYCFGLTTANFPKCTNIGSDAFYYCNSLTSVNFPVCTSIGNDAFYYCFSLASINFPICTSIGDNAFNFCDSLTSVSFPVCASIGTNVFNNCSSLTTASFPVCTNICSYAFRYCRKLSSLTLGASTVCTLSNSNTFSSTPYAGYKSYFSGTPYIYVPSSLVASYKAATNWTYFSSYFSAIEG